VGNSEDPDMGEKYDYLDYRENEAKLEQLRNRDMGHFS
jgi:hypothetical protein